MYDFRHLQVEVVSYSFTSGTGIGGVGSGTVEWEEVEVELVGRRRYHISGTTEDQRVVDGFTICQVCIITKFSGGWMVSSTPVACFAILGQINTFSEDDA